MDNKTETKESIYYASKGWMIFWLIFLWWAVIMTLGILWYLAYKANKNWRLIIRDNSFDIVTGVFRPSATTIKMSNIQTISHIPSLKGIRITMANESDVQAINGIKDHKNAYLDIKSRIDKIQK